MHRYEPADPAAMALTDSEATGRPAISMVLLKHTDTHRFVFYTHTTNPKGRDLATHPRAALCFRWAKLERQIRIEGTIEFTTTAPPMGILRCVHD